ncbi:magnesium transporter [Mariniblastus sp.]|nr:magnesium transporter [Mariniblastus sp.]
MVNTLFLPELREMLATGNDQEMAEFCTALHPARTADFMVGLTNDEMWQVLVHADIATQVDVFSYVEPHRQIKILETQDREQLAKLVAELSPDDRVDLLQGVDEVVLNDILQRMPVEERRDFLRLSQYPEGTAGAVMTTDFAKLPETLTVRQAMEEISRQSEEYETIYYLYIVDDEDHLRGLVSARQLLTSTRNPDCLLSDIMETDLIAVRVADDQEDVANHVARMDLLAIPVVDPERRILGIITHDDVIDVMREEATEDAHRSAAVDPLDESYLQTSVLTLTWKRGIWLAVLFFFALMTAFALQHYEQPFETWAWLVPFIPLVISSGGNSGSQSATLIITALSRGHITLKDYRRVMIRELQMGLLLGGGLALMGFLVCAFFVPSDQALGPYATLVVPLTLLLVVICGTLTGSVLPLVFEKLGWDPAMMSNPFVAGIVDILGILIYVTVAVRLLNPV